MIDGRLARKRKKENAARVAAKLQRGLKIVPADYLNPYTASGYDHVSLKTDSRPGRTNPKPFLAAHGKRKPGVTTPIWEGPRRATALEAAQDYCDYISGLKISRHEGVSGRPDWFMADDGTLHTDLPPASTTTAAKPKTRTVSSERAFIERMEARMLALLKPGDFAEAKAGTSRQQMCTAVGQLKYRRHEAGRGRMFLVVPERPSDSCVKWVESEGITLVIERATT